MAATFIAAGAKDVELPTLAKAREEFESALVAPVKVEVVDRDRIELLQALGVA